MKARKFQFLLGSRVIRFSDSESRQCIARYEDFKVSACKSSACNARHARCKVRKFWSECDMGHEGSMALGFTRLVMHGKEQISLRF